MGSQVRAYECVPACEGQSGGDMNGEGWERHWQLAILYVNNFLISGLEFELDGKQDVEYYFNLH